MLTPNHRTCVQLLEAYGNYRKHQQLPLVCLSANIFPVDIWIKHCWDRLSSIPPSTKPENCFQTCHIMSPTQELVLWQQVIRDSACTSELLNLNASAKSAQAAFHSLLHWNIPPQELHVMLTAALLEGSAYEDAQVFLQWLTEYQQRLVEDSAVNLAQLLPKVIEAIQTANVPLPEKMLLFGFDNPPPLYQQLFSAIDQSNVLLSSQDLQRHHPMVIKQAHNDKTQEMLAAAQWAKETLKNNPSANIGIICTDLHSRVNEFERVFNNCFYPDKIIFSKTTSAPCFTSTATQPLSSLPIIETALSMLAFYKNTLPTLDVCLLLRSNFLKGAEQESASRAALELCLRKNNESTLSLTELRAIASQSSKPWHCPILVDSLLALATLHRQHSSKRYPNQWLTIIEQHLHCLHWPLASTLHNEDFSTTALDENDNVAMSSLIHLTSEDLRAVEIWQDVLKNFSELGYISNKINFQDALHLLRQIASNSPSNHFHNQAPVKVLTPTESAGMHFSHVFVMGLSENEWPPASRPNPFIPIKIQQKYNLPGSAPELQYQTSLNTLKQLQKNTATQIIFTYPLQADNILINPSALLNEFKTDHSTPGDSKDTVVLHPYCLEQMNNDLLGNINTESFEDDITIPMLESEKLSGGTKLIADQAACPFRNFAIQRLEATDLPSISFGLPAYEVGNMLHYALEITWQELKNIENLIQLDSSQRALITLPAAVNAVAASAKKFPQTMTPHYCHLEQVRLNTLLLHWLEEESKREFFQVVEQEYRLEWKYSSLCLDLRIDRIEQFSDSSLGLVDYKSSKNNNSLNWLDERQDKPQLLLYLQAAEQSTELFPISSTSKVSSLLYAQVNIEDMKYKGLSDNETSYPGISLEKNKKLAATMDWFQLKQHWQQSLQGIAQQFLDGYLVVDPKSSSTCQYCHLGAFCRIQEVNSNRKALQ